MTKAVIAPTVIAPTVIAPTGVALPSAAPPLRSEPGPIRAFWARLTARRTAMVGLVIVAALILMAVFADWIAPYDPIATDWGAIRAAPGEALRTLARGHAVMVFPGGDFDAEKPFWRRDEVRFAGRRGWARLAIRAQVPVVPDDRLPRLPRGVRQHRPQHGRSHPMAHEALGRDP